MFEYVINWEMNYHQLKAYQMGARGYTVLGPAEANSSVSKDILDVE